MRVQALGENSEEEEWDGGRGSYQEMCKGGLQYVLYGGTFKFDLVEGFPCD